MQIPRRRCPFFFFFGPFSAEEVVENVKFERVGNNRVQDEVSWKQKIVVYKVEGKGVKSMWDDEVRFHG